MLKMVREYKNKNILMKSGFRRQIELNFNCFNELIPYSSIIDDFQYRLFGVYVPEKSHAAMLKLRENQALKEGTQPDTMRGMLSDDTLSMD